MKFAPRVQKTMTEKSDRFLCLSFFILFSLYDTLLSVHFIAPGKDFSQLPELLTEQ